MSILNTPADPRHEVPNLLKTGLYRIIPLAAVILGFVIVSGSYTSLPAEIPVHFNGKGEIDGYGSKIMLWILPAVNLGVFSLLGWAATLRNYDWFNYPVPIHEENAVEQHRIALQLLARMRFVMCLMLSYLIYALVRSAQEQASMLNIWVLGSFLLVLFGTIGISLKAAFDAK